MQTTYGFLYLEYGPSAWWWEVEELVRKLLLSSLVVLIDAGSPLQASVSLRCPAEGGGFSAAPPIVLGIAPTRSPVEARVRSPPHPGTVRPNGCAPPCVFGRVGFYARMPARARAPL